jgi:hypothetical protein
MTTKYNFAHTAKSGQWEVKIDARAQYGYFEHEVLGEGGELWFVDGDLIDYDGVPALPKTVRAMINTLGFTTTEEDAHEAEEIAERAAARGMAL